MTPRDRAHRALSRLMHVGHAAGKHDHRVCLRCIIEEAMTREIAEAEYEAQQEALRLQTLVERWACPN